MIYITGDTHGEFDRIFDFCESMETTKNDIMIILGDVGINYHFGINDNRIKQELTQLPITLFCIHGNHEERPYECPDCQYEEIEWHNGIVYVEEEFPNLVFAKDGEVYDFEGKKTIVIGGAYSVDKYYRLQNGFKWFETEQPDEQIRNDVVKALDRLEWQVDVVLSHTCPYRIIPTHLFLSGIDQSKVDDSTERWLNTIDDRLTYSKWYFGHYHDYLENDGFIMLYEDIVEFE